MLEFNGIMIEAGDTYKFDLTNADGCDSVVFVTAVPIPLSYNEVELFACVGDSVFYNNTYLYPNSVQEIVLESFSGCDSTEQVLVTELGSAPLELNVEVCPDETYVFNDQEYEAGVSEIFSYSSSQGCDSIIQLNVAATPDFSFDYNSETICYDEMGEILINNMQGTTGPYVYSLDGINFQSENVFANLAPGDHMIYTQDLNGCIRSLPANIPVYDRLNIASENATITCDVDSVQLEATLVTGSDVDLQFTWPEGTTGTTFFAYDPGNYILHASNVCEDQTVEIVVSPAISNVENYLYVPNVFSPNGDVINDQFIVSPADNVIIHSFEIHVFDRWGEEEYSSTDISDGWDGTLKDGHFRPGVHVWWIRIDVSYCGDRLDGVFLKGDVSVIR